MRCAVPSSKVGSWDSAKAAAERDSGVEAAGLIGAACVAAVAAAAGAVVAGLAGGGAVSMAPAFWPDAGAAASNVAMATMVVVRMSDAFGRRHWRLGEINRLGCRSRTNGISPDPQSDFCKIAF